MPRVRQLTGEHLDFWRERHLCTVTTLRRDVATDGLFQTFLTVLDEFGAFPAVIQRELDRYLPFLATTKVLMAAVRYGDGRETAHEPS